MLYVNICGTKTIIPEYTMRVEFKAIAHLSLTSVSIMYGSRVLGTATFPKVEMAPDDIFTLDLSDWKFAFESSVVV